MIDLSLASIEQIKDELKRRTPLGFILLGGYPDDDADNGPDARSVFWGDLNLITGTLIHKTREFAISLGHNPDDAFRIE